MSVSTGLTGPERVVAAILRDGAGRILVARRPFGKPGGGLWEFPGGKLLAGESEDHALRRELAEELGIAVGGCRHLPHFRTTPPAHLQLSFWEVEDYQGRPHGCEGQEIRWCLPDELTALAFLPADGPILPRLRLPEIYLVSDVDGVGAEAFESRLQAMAARAPCLVQLRERWPAARLCAYAQHLRALLRPYGGRCLINGDPAALASCADGMHLSAARLLQTPARPLPAEALLGASCHDAAELHHAVRIGCDFAVLSPVAATPSHPNAAPLGWERFAELAAAVPIPVYALGGMRLEDRRMAQERFAQGVALRSALGALSARP